MNMLTIFSKIFVYQILILSLITALGVVMLSNIFHAALCLAATLIGVAALYLALQAEFIAVVQILLYVGAVMTVIIFAIMLTHRIGDKTLRQSNKQSLPAFLALTAFVVWVSSLILKTNWAGGGDFKPAPAVDTLGLGKALLGEYIFPFEIISVVLIAGLIGAVVIARKD